MHNRTSLSRRTFIQVGAVAMASMLAPVSLSGCVESMQGGATTQSVTDMAGRTVNLPSPIKTVYSTGQPGVVALYMLAPNKLLGWCMKPSSSEREYLESEYLDLPVLGLMQGENNTANREEIISLAPDCILLMTGLDDEASIIEATADADSIADKMGIPVLVMDYGLATIGESFRALGRLLNVEERAEQLAEYCESVYENAVVKAATIAPEDKISVYYAQGSSGLQTAPQGSSHSEVLDLVGGDNVAKVDFGSGGRVNVDMEQVVIWDPSVIIASYSMSHTIDGNAVFSIIEEGNKSWAEVSAVQNGLIYNTPSYPFNWQDMPPSANRIIGISWLGNLLYPKVFDCDIRQVAKEFYALFYRVELSEDQLDKLLQNAVAK